MNADNPRSPADEAAMQQLQEQNAAAERKIASASTHLERVADATTLEDARRFASLALYALRGGW